MKAEVHKEGKIYMQEFRRGIPQNEVHIIGETTVNGTTITFIPDDTIFDAMEFSYNTLATRIKNAAYLTPGVTFTIIDEVSGNQEILFWRRARKPGCVIWSGRKKCFLRYFLSRKKGKRSW